MKKLILFFFLFISSFTFCQNGKYWIKFKDKNHSSFSLSNPQQFLSQKSLDRRTRQNIQLNETDLPISEAYLDSVSPFINRLVHRIKWFNLIVVDMSNAISLRTDTFAFRDTTNQNDTFSITVYDTIVIHRAIHTTGTTISYDTTSVLTTIAVHDSFVHPGPIYYRDTIILTDVITSNNFDSLKHFSCIDTLAEIQSNPTTRSTLRKSKFEDVSPVDQHIIYPSKYGAAYHQINMLNADLLHQMGYRGEGITISMMDNGYYHVDSIAAYDSVRSRIMGTWDFVNNEANVYNDGSHGENTFSCIAANLPNKFLGTAPDANFYLFVTEDDNAEWVMEEYNWAAAAVVADSVGAQIFSTSLGYTQFDNGIGSHSYSDLIGHSTVITNAGNMAFGKGILVINAAGNEGASGWHYISAPADGDSILAIGAVDSARDVASFSSRGPNAAGRIKPDVCSQGQTAAVISTPGGYTSYSSGTSFSCPIMAGCAASLWGAFPDKTAREIYDAIVISADHFWTPDNNHGYGIPNFYNAYLLLKTNYNGGILRINDGAAVYPNPFSTELNVSIYSEEAGDHKIELFDLVGRKVYSTQVYIRNKTFEVIKLDAVPSLPIGEYVIRIDGNKNLTQPLVKVK